jgi:hypothetical protein
LGKNGLHRGTDLPGLGVEAACGGQEPTSPYIGVGVTSRNGLGGVLGYREDGGRAMVVCSV